MARRLLVAALLALASVSAPAALAQGCTFGPGGQLERCDFNAPSRSSDSPPPWYADPLFQAALAVVGLLGSAGAGIFAVMRVRARRRSLAELLREVEATYATSKSEPSVGLPRLVSLRHEVRERYEKGRLEDAQFLELDKRITAYVTRLRLGEIDRRFRDLPPHLTGEVRRVVSDGTVSEGDVELTRRVTRDAAVSAVQRDALVALVAAWANEDAGAHRLRGASTRAVPSGATGAPPKV